MNYGKDKEIVAIDLLGKKLKKGDDVVTITPYTKQLTKGKILKIMPKTVHVEYVAYRTSNGKNHTAYTYRPHNKVVKI